MKRTFLLAALFAAAFSSCQVTPAADPDVFSLQEKADTLLFKQAPFEWKVTPRYDYSKMFTTKLFLCQAEYDGDFLGRCKTHDNGEQTFMKAVSIEAGFDEFKKGFCEKSLICQYLNTFGRKALIKGENGNSIGVFEDGVRTMYEKDGEKMSVAKDGIILASDGNVFIPAVWLGNGNIVAFSEKGYNGKTWTVPSGVELPRNAKAWTIDQDGRTRFTDFKIKGRQVTLTLDPGQMVLIEL